MKLSKEDIATIIGAYAVNNAKEATSETEVTQVAGLIALGSEDEVKELFTEFASQVSEAIEKLQDVYGKIYKHLNEGKNV